MCFDVIVSEHLRVCKNDTGACMCAKLIRVRACARLIHMRACALTRACILAAGCAEIEGLEVLGCARNRR